MNKIPNAFKRFLLLTAACMVIAVAVHIIPTYAAESQQIPIYISVATDGDYSNTTGGGATGDGTYAVGETVTLQATPNEGYVFVGWYGGGVLLTASTTYSFAADYTQFDSYEARFETAPATVTITVTTSGGGNVTGDGTYAVGDTITVSAVPYENDAISFYGWYEDGVVVSTNAVYSFTAEQDRTLEARFGFYNDINITNVTTDGEDNTTGGSATGYWPYAVGDTATFEATPNEGFIFAGWYSYYEGTFLSADASYSFAAVHGQDYYEARFVSESVAVDLEITPNNDYGNVTVGGIYVVGATITVEAVPNEGSIFVGWYEDGVLVSTDDVYSYVVTEQVRELEARFELDPLYIQINVSVATDGNTTSATGGSATGGGVYKLGDTVALEATPNEGFVFVGWYNFVGDGELLTTDTVYSFTAENPMDFYDYEARFETESSSVIIDVGIAPIGNAGNATGGGTYSVGDSVTLQATPNAPYVFDGWYENGVKVNPDDTYNSLTPGQYTFTAERDRVLVAQFKRRVTITITVGPPGSGTVTGGGEYTEGDTATVQTIPSDGYVFDGWYVNGVLVSTSPGYTITVTADITVEARFKPAQPEAYTVFAYSGQGGNATGGGTYAPGATVTVGAYPVDGYVFEGWYENGVMVSGSSVYSFTALANRVLEARFRSTSVYYNIYASAGQGGNTTGSGSYAPGETVTLQAIPATGYAFDGWYERGVFISAGDVYTFPATADRTLEARFTYIGNGENDAPPSNGEDGGEAETLVSLPPMSSPNPPLGLGNSVIGGGVYDDGYYDVNEPIIDEPIVVDDVAVLADANFIGTPYMETVETTHGDVESFGRPPQTGVRSFAHLTGALAVLITSVAAMLLLFVYLFIKR